MTTNPYDPEQGQRPDAGPEEGTPDQPTRSSDGSTQQIPAWERPTDQPQHGQGDAGTGQYEHGRAGQPSYGQPQYGQDQSGQAPYVQDHYGQSSTGGQYGQQGYGPTPGGQGYGQTPGDQPSYGQTPGYGTPQQYPAYGAPAGGPPPYPGQAYGQGQGYGQPAYGANIMSDSDQRLWATLTHVSGLIFWFLGPLVLWLVLKERGQFIEDQTKEALNYQITQVFIGVAITFIAVVTLGLGSILYLWFIVPVIFMIIAAIKANGGERYRYPLCIRLVR